MKQEQEFQKATNCYYCNKNFEEFKLQKVRDHCHYTGFYRGASCSICNTQEGQRSNLFRYMLRI